MPTSLQKNSTYKPSTQELDMAFSGPAMISNRFYATMTPQGIRVSFAEQFDIKKIPVFRAALCLSYEDGIALYKVLQGLLQDVETSINKEKLEHKDDSTRYFFW